LLVQISFGELVLYTQTSINSSNQKGHILIHEIICPECHKAFKVGEVGYADILKQVRDGDFEKQLYERLELAEREKRDAIAVAEANVTNALQKTAAASASSHQPIQILIRPQHLDLAQYMAVRQMAHHLHRLRLRLFAGKAQQGAVGFGV